MNPHKKKTPCVLRMYIENSIKKRKGRFWIHPILEKREEFDACHTLLKNQLRQDEDEFYNYFNKMNLSKLSSVR